MLPKKKRLNRTEFNRFFVSGKRFHHPLCMVVYTPAPMTHISVVAPAKIWKTAVARNRFRRQIYALMRTHMEKIPKGAYIIIGKHEAVCASYEQLRDGMVEVVYKVSHIR